MFHFSFPSSASSLCLLSPLALMCCKQAKKGPAVWSYCWCQQEVLIAFAAEQKLDEGSGGALQTLWLQPRFSPTIPAPHSHCSAHPALPPPCQLRPRTEGKKKGKKRKFLKKFLQATTTARRNSPRQQLTLQHDSTATQTLSLVWSNICADISSGSLNNIYSSISREKPGFNCFKTKRMN